jgi:hypothetical protein
MMPFLGQFLIDLLDNAERVDHACHDAQMCDGDIRILDDRHGLFINYLF